MIYKFIDRYHRNKSSHCFTINKFIIEGDMGLDQLLRDNVLDNEIQPDSVRYKNDGRYLRGLLIPVFCRKVILSIFQIMLFIII